MKQNMVKRIMSGVLAAAMVFSSLTVSTATTAKAATQVNLQEGTEYIIVSKKSNKAITVKDNSKNDNAKIVQMPVTNSASQIWTLDSDGKGYYQLVNKNSGKALDVPNSSKQEGKAMIQWGKGNGDNQKWKISHVGSGYYRVTPKLSSKFALNVSGNSTKDGAEIIQWNYGNGSDNAKWEIREVKKQNSGNNGVFHVEAEDCGRNSNATLMDAPKASGGKLVGDLGNWSSGGGAFGFNVECNATGNYKVRVGYATAEDRTVAIINEPNGYKTHIHEIECKSTGDWKKPGTAEGSIYLAEGVNYITVSGVQSWAPNIDYIEIIGLNGAGESVLRLEAEDGTSASIMEAANASGGKLVGDIEDWDNPYSPDISFGYKIQCKKTGYYTIRVHYASAENRGLVWYAIPNGYKFNYGTIACPSTGSWTEVGEPVEEKVYLVEGTNELGFGGNNGWGPNVDYIEILGL